MSKIYTLTLPDNTEDYFEIVTSAGGYKLNISFRWPTAIQEQADIVYREWKNLAASDPILVDGYYDRDYDYIDYYSTIPYATAEQIEEWLEEQTALPHSLELLSMQQKIVQIRQRCLQCSDFVKLRDTLEQLLCWEVTVSSSDEKYVCLLRSGGWNNNQSDTFSWAFYSAKNTVGKGDLASTVMIIEVYDE